MTDEERRYKVKKIENYDELIRIGNLEIRDATLTLAIAILGFIANFSNAFVGTPLESILITMGCSGISLKGIIDMIAAICHKSNYEAEKIKEQFDLDYEEKVSRGGR